MGYRSDVKVLINIKEREVEDVVKEINEIANDFLFDNIKVNKSKKLVLCEVVCAKWYESFPEVKAFNKWLDEQGNKFNESQSGGIHFVKIGDDLDDIEEYVIGDVEYYLSIYRQIDDGDFKED